MIMPVNALLEWFDTVPLNKISAFGGDYLSVDGVYGHLPKLFDLTAAANHYLNCLILPFADE